MKRDLPMILIGLVMLAFVGCAGCAILEREGDADWSVGPDQQEAQQ